MWLLPLYMVFRPYNVRSFQPAHLGVGDGFVQLLLFQTSNLLSGVAFFRLSNVRLRMA